MGLYIPYINVTMVYEHIERRQDLLNGVDWWRWIFIPTQIDDYPGDVAQKGDGNIWIDEAEQRLDHTEIDDIIPEHGTIPDDVTQRPHGLLADVLVRRGQELQKQRHGVGLHHGLRLRRRSGGDVGQRPRGLELQRRIFRAAQTADQDGQDAGVDEGVDGRIAVGGEQLAGGLHGGQLSGRIRTLRLFHDGLQRRRRKVVAKIVFI